MNYVLPSILFSVLFLTVMTLVTEDVFAFFISDNEDANVNNGQALKFREHSVSISRTNIDGDGPGGWLNERGFTGIKFRVTGNTEFGTGNEKMALTVSKLKITNAHLELSAKKTIRWLDNSVSIGRTDASGSSGGTYLTERAFSGFIFKTGGSATFGTGDEKLRILPTAVVIKAPVLKVDNIVSRTGDICIGNCP